MRFTTPSLLLALSMLLVLSGTLYFASLRADYSHITHTISELGETGAAQGRLVGLGVFLPAGLLLWSALWLLRTDNPEENRILWSLSCLGTGYVMAALFPCDHGSPLVGTWRQQIHNAFGLVEYAGTGFGLLLLGKYMLSRTQGTAAYLFLLAGGVVLLCLVLLSLPSFFAVRGAVQRVAELLMFVSVFAATFFFVGSE